MHQCPSHKGLDVPLVHVKTGTELDPRAQRHRVMERGDYIGSELGASPVMAVRTEYADGRNDCHVFAPTATMKAG